MPAILDDPTAPTIFRVSGEPPFPAPHAPLPADIVPRQVTLRDRVTIATIVPFSSPSQVPLSLVSYLCDQLNKLIEEGDTYPMVNSMPLESFGPYWFGNFAAVMILGDIRDAAQVRAMAEEGADWEKLCLGTFYTKPNYPGRSSHVCNAGFVTTDASRNRGVGRLMGEQYVKWAPKLVCVLSVTAHNRLTACSGLHLFRIQPRIRDERCILPHLGCSRVQANWSRQGLRQSQVVPRPTSGRNYIRP